MNDGYVRLIERAGLRQPDLFQLDDDSKHLYIVAVVVRFDCIVVAVADARTPTPPCKS